MFKTQVSWNIVLCQLISIYQRFEGAWSLHIQGQRILSQELYTSWPGFMSDETWIFSNAAVRTSNLRINVIFQVCVTLLLMSTSGDHLATIIWASFLQTAVQQATITITVMAVTVTVASLLLASQVRSVFPLHAVLTCCSNYTKSLSLHWGVTVS
jgi:hypothetical protein